MQCEDSDSNEISKVTNSDSFGDPQISNVWRSHKCYEMSNLMHHKSFAQKIRKRRKPVWIKHKPMYQKTNSYDHPMPSQNSNVVISQSVKSLFEQSVSQICTFKQREITTIHEEVFQRSKSYHSNRISKGRGYQEKVASLKVIVGRLQKMCVEKPEVLQNSIPEETIKLFKAIHI
ncbi:uncharacterized protein TNCV_420451 [Trichonephila clavipes]|uniref:Uncharacterized protein n=1 Tax=Trichonephila clavipes TaxID=2585209 RepID=A0A8X6SA91_TRICX|nr:uncharacterized protein TNCV_420451 [Trichonephila clavipes]